MQGYGTQGVQKLMRREGAREGGCMRGRCVLKRFGRVRGGFVVEQHEHNKFKQSPPVLIANAA
jgi:hypothetical protein